MFDHTWRTVFRNLYFLCAFARQTNSLVIKDSVKKRCKCRPISILSKNVYCKMKLFMHTIHINSLKCIKCVCKSWPMTHFLTKRLVEMLDINKNHNDAGDIQAHIYLNTLPLIFLNNSQSNSMQYHYPKPAICCSSVVWRTEQRTK